MSQGFKITAISLVMAGIGYMAGFGMYNAATDANEAAVVSSVVRPAVSSNTTPSSVSNSSTANPTQVLGSFFKPVSSGSTGLEVLTIQQFLNVLSLRQNLKPIAPTGTLDSATQSRLASLRSSFTSSPSSGSGFDASYAAGFTNQIVGFFSGTNSVFGNSDKGTVVASANTPGGAAASGGSTGADSQSGGKLGTTGGGGVWNDNDFCAIKFNACTSRAESNFLGAKGACLVQNPQSSYGYALCIASAQADMNGAYAECDADFEACEPLFIAVQNKLGDLFK